MNLYFLPFALKSFGVTLGLLMSSQEAFSQQDTQGGATKQPAALYYPAIQISPALAQQLFLDSKKNMINCPSLLDGTLSFPNGYSVSLCGDAQLACIRYGLITKEMEQSKGALLEELKKTFELEKQNVTIKLRGCQLILKRTINGESLMDAAGYPYFGVGAGAPQPGASGSSGGQ